jgi:branched-subunit amino acid transport protein
MNIWLAILAMGALTLALRASFLLPPERLRLPVLLRRALPFVPAVVAHGGGRRNWRCTKESYIGWRWRLTFATIASGLLALHLFDWLL